MNFVGSCAPVKYLRKCVKSSFPSLNILRRHSGVSGGVVKILLEFGDAPFGIERCRQEFPEVRSGMRAYQIGPEQRVAASTLQRYTLGLRLTIAQADARPAMPVSFRFYGLYTIIFVSFLSLTSCELFEFYYYIYCGAPDNPDASRAPSAGKSAHAPDTLGPIV